MEELDEKFALAMFIKALRLNDMYVSLKTNPLASYATTQWANRYVDTEEAVQQKRKQESSMGVKRPRALEAGRLDRGDRSRSAIPPYCHFSSMFPKATIPKASKPSDKIKAGSILDMQGFLSQFNNS